MSDKNFDARSSAAVTFSNAQFFSTSSIFSRRLLFVPRSLFLVRTRRERPKLAPYLRLKKRKTFF